MSAAMIAALLLLVPMLVQQLPLNTEISDEEDHLRMVLGETNGSAGSTS